MVSHIAPPVTEQHLRAFFSFCGNIQDFEVQEFVTFFAIFCFDSNEHFCREQNSSTSISRIKIEFSNTEEAKVALCLNNTALGGSMIRIESLAMLHPNSQSTQGNEAASQSQQQQLEASKQLTYAEQLQAAKNEEIARTVYCGNINSRVSIPQIVDFFSECGPVAFIRMAGNEQQPTRFAFVEFVDNNGAQRAMSMSGRMLEDKPIKFCIDAIFFNHYCSFISCRVNSSNNPILKPPVKLSHEEQRRLQYAVSQLSEKLRNPSFQIDYSPIEHYHTSRNQYYNYEEQDESYHGRKRSRSPAYDNGEDRRIYSSHRHRYDDRDKYSSSRYPPRYSSSSERSSRHSRHSSRRSPEREYKRHKYE